MSLVSSPASHRLTLRTLLLDGLDGAVINIVPPIVSVTPGGNYLIQGKRVIDAGALSQMSIPSHEICVQVTKSSVVPLLVGE